MHEAVSQELPYASMQDERRHKRRPGDDRERGRRRRDPQQQQDEVRAEIPEDQFSRESAEVGEGENTGGAWHGFILSLFG